MTDPYEPTAAADTLARETARRADISAAALERHRNRMRRQRLIYYPIVSAILIALVIVFAVAYLHGEAHNTRSITAKAPAALALRTPAANQHEVWHTGDRAALGNPQYGATIVVWGGHTVRGVNARTGAQTWSYYRSDRTVCTAGQLNGVAVAVYELDGNCDELTGLNAATGARVWTRTLDFNGLPLFGHPAYQVDQPDSTFMITSPTVIYAIGVGLQQYNDGENFFTYSHFGCQIKHAVIGSAGALISQTCGDPRCDASGTRLAYCGTGPQLLLRGDPTEDVDNTSTTNPNHIVWNLRGDTDVPVSAGSIISAGGSTADLTLLAAANGKTLSSVPFDTTSWTSASTVLLSDGDQLVWAGGRTALISDSSDDAVWTDTAPGPPTTSGATVVEPTTSGVRVLDQSTGRVQQSFALSPAPAAGSTIARLGDGFLISSPSGMRAFA